MTRPVRLRDLANEFDTFFLDVWGVLHTGEGPLPGVLDTLRAARDAGTRIVLLTNTSRLGPQVVETLGKIGITRDLFTDVVTAGDVTRDAIVARDPAIFRDLPASPAAFHFGARDYVPWLFELGLDLDATPEDVLYTALNRLMMHARENDVQGEIIQTKLARSNNLPLWADTAGSVHNYEGQDPCEPGKSKYSV